MLLAGCGVAIGILALIVFLDRAPIGNAAAVTGTFLHYSNDASGVRLAVFRISNQSQLPIQRERYYEVHVRNGPGWTNQPAVHLRATAVRQVVRPGRSEIFAIKAPMSASRWRLCFSYIEHESWIRRIWQEFGLRSKQAGGYAGFSNEVDP